MCLSLGDIDESVVRVESLEIVPEGSTEEEEEEEEEEAAAIEADDESERNVCCDNGNPFFRRCGKADTADFILTPCHFSKQMHPSRVSV